MSAELIGILGVGVALGALIFNGQRSTNKAIAVLQDQVGGLRERMARLEGLFHGFTGSPKARG